MAKWAVFDVDGTLLPESSMERLFLRESVKKRLIPRRNFLRYALTAAGLLMAGKINDAFKKNKSFMKNLPVEAIESAAKACFKSTIAPQLSAEGLEVVNRRRQHGYKILLMTGSPEFLARHLKPLYQPDELVCLHLETAGEVYSGKVEGLHPFGQRKKEILLRLQDELDINFRESAVFANHHSDAPHMELFGEAVAVNPTPKLREIAGERRWAIASWD